MSTQPHVLPTPHLAKLSALVRNPRLPEGDRDRVEEAIKRYHGWVSDLQAVTAGQADTVAALVEATNRYKRFIELDLIFDSPADFLYRQKGQLKLDNTILEEFLPHLIVKGVTGLDDTC